MSVETALPRPAEALWHACECGGYLADLELWRELAAGAPDGPVVELGAGIGRVSLDLARAGHPVTAVERDPDLARELARTAAQEELEMYVVEECAWSAPPPKGGAGIVLATMQFLQLASSRAAMDRLIERWAGALVPDGWLAAAIIDGDPEGALGDPRDALPDVLEVEGWVAQSTPVRVGSRAGRLEVERQRELVSPSGEHRAQTAVSSLMLVSAGEVERAMARSGLRPCSRIEVPQTVEHVASTVVLAEARGG